MKLKRITIENFRCYYGRSDIELNQSGKITLIYGDSGFGKSSLLQFFRWMFYGETDFGKNNDKPLFNLSAFKEAGQNDTRVYGCIDFEHLGVDYSLEKEVVYSFAFNPSNARVKGAAKYTLLFKENDEWKSFDGDILNKINGILPKELSKYFLLDGERSRDIVLNSKELKNAIYSLFGLDVYNESLRYIGRKSSKDSIVGQYYKKMMSSLTSTSGGMSPGDMTDAMQMLYEEIESLKAQRKDAMARIDDLNARSDEILKTLGAASTKDNLKRLIKANQTAIEQNEQKIKQIRKSIGDLFYRWYPYLFLAELSKNTSKTLRDKNKEFAQVQQNVFETLKKDLLKEILDKHLCVCGRELDEDSKLHIENIVATMPPDSYIYQFTQFVSRTKRQIVEAQGAVVQYESLLSQITELENKISDLDAQNRGLLEELKRYDECKDLVDELESLRSEIKSLNNLKAGLEGKIAKKKQVYDISKKQLTTLLQNAQVSSFYEERIRFFEELHKLLDQEKAYMEQKVKATLNECVKNVFRELTTQVELDIDQIQFINNDFSLRSTYLTGGQQSVDVYSYVIGIIKALQECDMENNENPIIIDAPFAFTGNAQSEHLFKTLPQVSKQTILLTLDLNKIRGLLNDTDSYEFFVIHNESQEKATIGVGDIHDINF